MVQTGTDHARRCPPPVLMAGNRIAFVASYWPTVQAVARPTNSITAPPL